MTPEPTYAPDDRCGLCQADLYVRPFDNPPYTCAGCQDVIDRTIGPPSVTLPAGPDLMTALGFKTVTLTLDRDADRGWLRAGDADFDATPYCPACWTMIPLDPLGVARDLLDVRPGELRGAKCPHCRTILPFDSVAYVVARAQSIAKRVHGSAFDINGEPQLGHVYTVAASARRLAPDRFADRAEIVGLLHDVADEGGLIDYDFGEDVGAALRLLTRDPAVPYAEYIRRIVTSANMLAVCVAYADVLDNLRPPSRHADRYQLAADALRAAYDLVMNVNRLLE